LLSIAFADGGGQFAFGVVAVPELDGPPVVDHDDGGGVDGDVVGVVGRAVERGEVFAQPPDPPVPPEWRGRWWSNGGSW
jgi:hypothetical protein